VAVSDRLHSDGRFALEGEDSQRLLARLELAVGYARRTGQATLATLGLRLPADVDPSAVVCASRRPAEPWFVFEQPDRGRSALAALGEAASLSASGSRRFAELARSWRTLAATAVCDPADGRQLQGPLALGGFAFAPEGGYSPQWSGFQPASLIVPEVALIRDERGGERRVCMTVSVLAEPDDVPEELLSRLQRRLAELRERPLPLLDPQPVGHFHVASVMPPEHYEAAVSRAVELISAGQLQKIVLAREVQIDAPSDYDPAAIFAVLRDAFPSCFAFCVGRGEATLVAASPELLVRREGQRLSTLALAGSTRRSADPAVDDYLGERLMRDDSYREEHAIVARRIERTLRNHAIWVAAAPEPTLVRIANIQHLATPIRAQLAGPIDVVELAGMMHPTPAVGGEPSRPALELIPALEGMDRGWYAGPVGWTDASGDGEFCVALRCALLRGKTARCYAGNGIVRDSQRESELAETEIKLGALLPLLCG
jgi:salicylate biosynthesis isochorismate synthase/menaquinone-specific isochorismate synthase